MGISYRRAFWKDVLRNCRQTRHVARQNDEVIVVGNFAFSNLYDGLHVPAYRLHDLFPILSRMLVCLRLPLHQTTRQQQPQ